MNVSEQYWSAGYRRGYDDAKRDYSNVVEAPPVPEVQPAPGDSIPWTTTTISPNALELVVVRLENLEKRVASLDDWSHIAVKQIMLLNDRLDNSASALKYESKLAAERFKRLVESDWLDE